MSFFGCEDCAKNFRQEVRDFFPLEHAKTVVDQVLWLWRLQDAYFSVNIAKKIAKKKLPKKVSKNHSC